MKGAGGGATPSLVPGTIGFALSAPGELTPAYQGRRCVISKGLEFAEVPLHIKLPEAGRRVQVLQVIFEGESRDVPLLPRMFIPIPPDDEARRLFATDAPKKKVGLTPDLARLVADLLGVGK